MMDASVMWAGEMLLIANDAMFNCAGEGYAMPTILVSVCVCA